MHFQVTVRYGTRIQSYHMATVEAEDLPSALVKAAEAIPEAVAREADLAEVRPAAPSEDRPAREL